MTVAMRLVVLSVLLMALAGTARADYLEVRRSATLKEAPRSDAVTRQRLQEGDLLLLRDAAAQQSGYYHAVSTPGTDGWVYRTFVRRQAGPIPGSVEEASAVGPAEAPDWTAAEMVFMGVPRATSAESQFEVLENVGFAVGYSEVRRNPLWAAFRLFPVDDPPVHPRPSRFRIDERTTARVGHDCYTNNGLGLDRGHMAPNQALDSRFGREGQRDTFQLSNVAPQQCGLNREPWEALEKVTANAFAQLFANLFVVTGPIFSDAPAEIDCDVQIPEAFFKVVVESESTATPRMLSVVMVQEDTGHSHRLRDFITTVDCIESLTGLDLFPELPDAVEESVEAQRPDEDWDLDQVLQPSFFCPGGTAADIQVGNEGRAALLARCSS